MRCTRSKYNYLVRSLKRSRDLQIRCTLDRSLLSYDNRDYWKEISKIRSKCRSSSSVINGYTDSTDIVNEFASKYNVLYNSVTRDPTDMQSMAVSIRKDIITTSDSTDHSFSHVITMPDIKSAVKKLRTGQSGGISAITSDCFIQGTDSLYALIAMLLHGHFQMFLGVYFNTDTKRITCGCTENPKLPCNCTEQHSW